MIARLWRSAPLLACLCALSAMSAASGNDPVFEDGFESLPLTALAVEPPLVLAPGGLQATAHVDGLLEAPALVRLLGPEAQTLEAAWSFDPAVPGLLEVDLPAGLASGAWSLEVQRADGLQSTTLPDAFGVTDDLSVAFEVLTPVLPDSGGLIRLSSEGAFQNLPQVMLRAAEGNPDALALPLQGVRFIDPGAAEAPLPSGFTPDAYDVLVINPDGSAGVVLAGLSVSPAPPPRIETVTPGTLAGLESYAARIDGNGFSELSTVSQSCDDGSELAVPVVFDSESRLSVTLDQPASLPAVCLVNVHNPDGQSDTWSALRYYSPALNPSGFAAGANLETARRAPAMAMAGLPGGRQRVYAIGGDDGTAQGVLDSIEFAETSLFGGLGPWRTSRIALPSGRSFAWASAVGQFLYLVGGDDGAAAVITVLRAQLLDPADAPASFRHTFHLRNGAALPAGLRSYRVAPAFPADDPANPGGEGLAGAARHAYAPAVAGLALELRWQPVAGASGYRVYLGNELVAVTAGTTFIDDGQATDPTQTPLVTGETGQWHAVQGWNLGAARSDFAGALSPLPGEPDSAVLLAFGGVDDEGVILSSYEYSIIGAAATGTPTLGAWTVGAGSLAAPVRGLAAWPISTPAGDAHWIFVGSGRKQDGTLATVLERGEVSGSGDLGTLVAAAGAPASAEGGSPFTLGPLPDGTQLLLLVGGRAGSAGTSGQNSLVTDDGSGPDTGTWNTLPNLLAGRKHAGQAQGGAMAVIAGGEGSEGEALSSVEITVR